jgi:GT2 family glycosyltransferase
MDLSIIIVSYNTKEFLNGCLESIYQTTKNINFEVIVVDNASSDGTVKALRKLKNENLNLIENKKNLGFSKANNLGVKKASGRNFTRNGSIYGSTSGLGCGYLQTASAKRKS